MHIRTCSPGRLVHIGLRDYPGVTTESIGSEPRRKVKTGVRISVGAQISDKTSRNSTNIEEFLAGLRFEQRGKLDELPIEKFYFNS
jgi:ribosome biogenesis GTPase A